MGDGGEEVGGAGAGSAKGDADSSGDAGISVSAKSTALFVAWEDVVDGVAVFIDFVVKWEDNTTRDAEHQVDADGREGLAEDVGTEFFFLRHDLGV